MRRAVVTVVPLFISTLTACTPTGTGMGPCVHVYRDAVVHINAVLDAASGSSLDSVFVTGAAVNDYTLPLPLAVYGGGHEAGVLLDGDTLRCKVPCALGSTEGTWQLTLLARGYPLQTVAFDARYAVFHGGCPSYNDRGTSVVLHLATPAQDK